MKLNHKIGVLSDNFRSGLRDGLLKAKEVGADGVQFYAGYGEMAPAEWSAQAQKDLKSYISSLGLEVSALCVSLGGHGFQESLENPKKLDLAKWVLDFAKTLGTDIVTTHIGVIPYQSDHAIYEAMRDACEEISQFAESMGSFFAIETGPTTALHLRSFLEDVKGKGIAVNLDPANLVMVTGDDPVKSVYTLKDYIVHTHAKDGIRFLAVDPREIYTTYGYEWQEEGKIRQLVKDRKVYKETALGEGDVRFEDYFRALADIHYTGYLTIEREGGNQPVDDIREAVHFLRTYR